MLKEVKKIFSYRISYICLLIVIVFLSIFIFNAFRSKNLSYTQYEKVLSDILLSEMSEEQVCLKLFQETQRLETEVTEVGEYATQLQGEYSETLMGDFILYSKAYNTAQYIFYQIPNDRYNIINDSLYNIYEESEKLQPNKKIINSNNRVIEKYNRVINCELKSTGDFESMSLYFDNTLWDYIMIAFVIMITVLTFTMDISCGSYKIIYSSVNGRFKLFAKQLNALIFIVTILIIINAICQLICGFFFFGVKNLYLPLQMIERYELCPYLISIGDYLVIKFIAKLLFYIMIISISSMVTILSRKMLASCLFSFIVGILPLIMITYFFLYSLDSNSNMLQTKFQIYNIMRCIIPHSLLNLNVYFQTFDEINFWGFQVSRLSLVFFITSVIILISFSISSFKFGSAKKRG